MYVRDCGTGSRFCSQRSLGTATFPSPFLKFIIQCSLSLALGGWGPTVRQPEELYVGISKTDWAMSLSLFFDDVFMGQLHKLHCKEHSFGYAAFMGNIGPLMHCNFHGGQLQMVSPT